MNCFVKESYGVIWHFYHNAHGICYCKMTDENITEYNVLLKDGQEDFDILVDDSNCIHMVYQNKEGDILYANHFNGQWRRTTLLESKSREYYPKKFALKRVNNWLNILYCIEYNGRKMLTHQLIDSTRDTPEVIDCIRDDFSCVQDSAGNITVLYYSETNKAYGMRKYVWSKKEWNDFTSLPVINGCNNMFLFSDAQDCLHILYDRNFSIYEFCDGVENMIGTGQRPLMFHQKENVIMWEGVADNKIYIKKEGDKAPTVIMSGSFSKPVRFGLRYTTYEDGLLAECCSGNIINGSIRMYGINNFFCVAHSSPVNFTNNESENAAYIEMQKLKIKIDKLSGMVEKLQTQVGEYDIEKTDRRLKELETAVSKADKTKLFGLF